MEKAPWEYIKNIDNDMSPRFGHTITLGILKCNKSSAQVQSSSFRRSHWRGWEVFYQFRHIRFLC